MIKRILFTAAIIIFSIILLIFLILSIPYRPVKMMSVFGVMDDLMTRIIISKYMFLVLGVFLTVGGLIYIYFSLALIYYFFIKKVVPKNKILRLLIAFSQGFDYVSYPFEEIEKWPATTKLSSMIMQVLIGVGFLFVGKLMFSTIK